MIGFTLGIAPVFLRNQLGTDTDTHLGQIGVVSALGGNSRPGNPDLQQHALGHALGAMTSGGVNNFVTQNRGEFGFTFQLGQQSPIDADLASGQGPGVGNGIVEDFKFVGEFTITDPGKLLSNLADVGGKCGVGVIVTTLGLACRIILLSANGQFLLFADQAEFIFTGDRIDRAARQPQQDKVQGKCTQKFHMCPFVV